MLYPEFANSLLLNFQVTRFISRVTLLASGGAGHIYPTTTNPPVLEFLTHKIAIVLVDLGANLIVFIWSSHNFTGCHW